MCLCKQIAEPGHGAHPHPNFLLIFAVHMRHQWLRNVCLLGKLLQTVNSPAPSFSSLLMLTSTCQCGGKMYRSAAAQPTNMTLLPPFLFMASLIASGALSR